MATKSATSRPEPRHNVAHLAIEADRCVGVLPRVLGILAQQSLIPVSMSFHGGGERLTLVVDFNDPGEHVAQLLIGRIERIVTVRSIALTRFR